MPKVTDTFIDLHGLFPSLGHTQQVQVGVLRGRNFRWQAKGPYSGWGHRQVTPPIPAGTRYVATFRIEDHVIALSPQGAWRLSSPCTWERICTFIPTIWPDPCDNDYPWSSAYVGDTWFFAHPQVGLVRYSKCDGGWKCQLDLRCEVPAVTGYDFLNSHEGKFPAVTGDCIAGPIYSITQSHNRLIVLARDTVGWSMVDNGEKLCCDLHCGGGFQSLSYLRYGQPIGVTQTPSGFITWTTNGMAHFTALGNAAQFRVDHVSDNHVPINPWAFVQHDAKITYYVGEHGLFQTDGTYPREWLPEVGTYLAEHEIPRALKRDESRHGIAMFYHAEAGEIFISMTALHGEARDNLWTRSLVFDEHHEKVGSFDVPHRWIGPTNFLTHRKKHHSYGFIAEGYQVMEFDESRHNVAPTADCSCIPTPLDSWIEIGAITARDPRAATRETEMQRYRIHAFGGAFDETLRHHHATLGEVDQYEEHLTPECRYKVASASSHDGYSIVNEQWQDGWLVEQSMYAQTYACNHMGMFHTIKIVADDVSDYYEITRIDVDLYVTGQVV